MQFRLKHRLIKTQIGHARDFTWYRGQRPSPARVILSHERVQIHARENLCSYATNPPFFRVRELLLCVFLITRAGDGRWPRYQAKSLACPGCGLKTIAVNKVTNRWRNHNNKTTKISELNKIIELYELQITKQAARKRHMRKLYKHSRQRFLGNRSLTCAIIVLHTQLERNFLFTHQSPDRVPSVRSYE